MKQTDKRILLFLLAFAFILGGIKMLASLESPVEASPANTSDTQLLARCVNGEARGEPFEGQVAVAAVILNRVKHASFPNTIPVVIYQP